MTACEAWVGHGDGHGNAVACGNPNADPYKTDRGYVWLCQEHKPRPKATK